MHEENGHVNIWAGKLHHMEVTKKKYQGINQKSIFLTRSDIHAMRLMNPRQSIISISDHDLKSCSEQER